MKEHYLSLKKDGALPVRFELLNYDEAAGGGHLDKASTLAELKLSSLKIKSREGDFVPVAFDTQGLSRKRFKADQQTLDVTGEPSMVMQPGFWYGPPQAASLPQGTSAHLLTGGSSLSPEISDAPLAVQKFWAALGGPYNGVFLQVPNAFLFGNATLGDTLYIRSSYVELYDIMTSKFSTTGGVGILGNPGIGKSMMAAYILHQCKVVGTSVIYHRLGEPGYLFGWKDGHPHVWQAKDPYSFTHQHLAIPGSWYVVDAQKPMEFPGLGLKTVLLTSPNPDVHDKFLQARYPTLYMDTWTREELATLRSQCYPSLSDEDYNELLSKYGPVPRWVLAQTSNIDKSQWYNRLYIALAKTDSVTSIMSVCQMSADDKMTSHVLVHQRSSSDHLQCFYTVASEWVAEKMVDHALQMGRLRFTSVMCCMSNTPGWESVFGELFQPYVIRYLAEHGGAFEVRGPRRKSRDPVEMVEMWPDATYEFQQLQDISLKPNSLYAQYPNAQSKLPAADALFTCASGSTPSYLIQVTVARRKPPLSPEGVKGVMEALGAMYKSQFESTGEPEWEDKDVRPTILYVVPTHRFKDFQADPTPDPTDPKQQLDRLVVHFPVSKDHLEPSAGAASVLNGP